MAIHKTKYKSEKWLNPTSTPSTGSMVCYDGEIIESPDAPPERWAFLEIGDCRQKARIHMAEGETIEEFIEKVKAVKMELTLFIEHLNRTIDK